MSVLTSYSGGGSGGTPKTAAANTSATPGLVLGANVVMPMRAQTWSPSNDQKISELNPRLRQPATNFINETEDWKE
jgi:hypothetical protein